MTDALLSASNAMTLSFWGVKRIVKIVENALRVTNGADYVSIGG